MTPSRLVIAGLIVLSPTLPAFADAPAPPPPMDVWTGKGQAGFVDSTGNTQSTAANAVLDAAYYTGPWKHAAHLDGLYGKSAGVTSAERWEAGWQSNYDLSPRVFAFGQLRYDHDLFSGFQYQASGSVGAGYKIIDSDSTKLAAQGGVGYRRLRAEEIDKNGDGDVTSRTLLDAQGSAVFTGELDYSQQFTATTSLTNKFMTEIGAGDTLLKDNVALAIKISTKLALSVGYEVDDNTKPPPGLKKIDTVTTVNLVYAF